MNKRALNHHLRIIATWLVLALAGGGSELQGTDYFLTIGGGYQPDGNQASLEANVLFFQDVIVEKHVGRRTQSTFFADGDDPQADLQVLSQTVAATVADNAIESQPAVRLLEDLYSFRGNQAVEYRNHRIANVSGANAPESIHASLKHMCGSMVAGDRLFVYVTAHGSEAKGRNKYNTSISCWDGQSISAREFENWLDDVPLSVPVVMVMAQCYCGGFAHTIFDNADRNRGLASQLRVGFYAQQHNLPAAGCRPDIENDEEYSSYFWGAFVGRSRTGKTMSSADFNNDGRITFAEAHAHAMLASPTIDIPLRSSEAVLRTYSEISGYDHRRDGDTDLHLAHEAGDAPADLALAAMMGSARDIVRGAAVELQQTVHGLLGQLEISPDAPITTVFSRFEQLRDTSRVLRRDASRQRRRGSGRRELRAEIADKWPDLSGRQWRSAELLRAPDQSALYEEMQQLPSFERYRENQLARAKTSREMEQTELREVKFQRLINTLEAIVLAQNLSKLAQPEIVEHYQRMLALEQSTLVPAVGTAK